MRIRNIPLVFIAILTLINPLVGSSAATAHIDDGELWSNSDTVIIGTVTSITSEELDNRIYHTVDVEVERYLKNPSEAPSIVIHYYNVYPWKSGSLEEPNYAIDSISSERRLEFKVGERVYVFLRRLTPEYYEVYGGNQGKYTIFDGMAMNSYGRRMSIPTPLSPTIVIEMGLGVALFLTIWIKRDWLSERIVRITN
jgi:hypothetical protein